MGSDLYSRASDSFHVADAYKAYTEFVATHKPDDADIEKVVAKILPIVRIVLIQSVIHTTPSATELEDFVSISIDKLWKIVKEKIIYHNTVGAFYRSLFVIVRNHLLSNITKVRPLPDVVDADYARMYPGIKPTNLHIDTEKCDSETPRRMFEYCSQHNVYDWVTDAKIYFIIHELMQGKPVLASYFEDLTEERFTQMFAYVRNLCRSFMWQTRDKYSVFNSLNFRNQTLASLAQKPVLA